MLFLPNEFVSHATQEKSNPRPFKPERVGHPEKLNRFLGDDVLEWCYSLARVCQREKCESVGHLRAFYDREGAMIYCRLREKCGSWLGGSSKCGLYAECESISKNVSGDVIALSRRSFIIKDTNKAQDRAWQLIDR